MTQVGLADSSVIDADMHLR